VERPALRRPFPLLLAGALALVLLAAVARWLGSPTGLPFGGNGDTPRRMVPEGTRIRVEVLNATTTRGLARRATLYLRDRGFDVVAIGTATEQRDSTLVIDRAGNAEWARLVSRALGDAPVEIRPDSSGYLDVTVLIGASWRPPAQPFYP
jgi:hypothetical protein